MEDSMMPCVICCTSVQDKLNEVKVERLNVEDKESIENDKIFQWFLIKFMVPPKKGSRFKKLQRFDEWYKKKCGWDGVGGGTQPLPFCGECKVKLIGLMEINTEGKKFLDEGIQQLKWKMRGCEEEFEDRGIYDKDPRYRRVRRYIIRVNWRFVGRKLREREKANRLSVKDKLDEDKVVVKEEEEDTEDWPWEEGDPGFGIQVKEEDDPLGPDPDVPTENDDLDGNYNFRNCLLCYKAISKKESSLAPVLTNDLVEQNLNSVFILRKMLGIPRGTLEGYLEIFGCPGKWVEFCKNCLGVVDKALRIQKEISELEDKLRRCQEEMKDKIKLTWKKKRMTVTPRKTNQDVSRITEESRQFVVKSISPVDSDDEDVGDNGPVETFETWSPSLVDDIDNGNGTPTSASSPAKKPKLTAANDDVNSEKQFNYYLKLGNYSCPLCPTFKMMSLAEFQSHIIFHAQRPFKCSICNLHWSGTQELQEKNPFAKEPQSSNGHLCSGSTLVKIPEDGFNPGKIWECNWCPERYTLASERDSHEDSEHSLLKNELKMNYNCLSCNGTTTTAFRTFSEWVLHRALEHPGVVASSCLYCDYLTAIQKNGVPTLTKDHNDPNSFDPPTCARMNLVEAPETCDFCGVTSDKLGDHLKTVHKLTSDLSRYSCHYCWSRFGQLSELTTHKKVEHSWNGGRREPRKKIKVYCDICGKMAIGRWGLVDHKLIKHGIEPEGEDATGHQILTCEKGNECGGFRTLYMGTMRNHMMRKHGAERRWKCDECGKGFTDSGKLWGHKQIHKNKELKPFQCEICGNSFALKNYLYIHTRLSHQNKPFASTNKKRPKKIVNPVAMDTN